VSGIAGVVHLDGSPVDRALLERMTARLSFRGPHATETWADGAAGLGHALLRTTDESLHERQPCSLDGRVWITADARIDAREELIAQLAGKGCRASASSPDVELILHAYSAWGPQCVEHLLGDFAFAIWDAREHCLFCARDHFGVRQFFYARVGPFLVFSNTLQSLRMHPAVSDKLNDLAIADFLVFGMNQDPATTSFADVQRLPPAHTLAWQPGQEPQVKRYWALPIEGPARFRRREDCVEQFRTLLRAAVRDRLRTSKVGCLMSGGLDSTSVAATAKTLFDEYGASRDLRAYTIVYDELIPDQERRFAQIVAEGIGLPIEFLPVDQCALFEEWDSFSFPEPVDAPLASTVFQAYREAARTRFVALTGEGGDPATAPSLSFYLGPRLGALVVGTIRYWISHRRIPPLGFRVTAQRWLGRNPKSTPYPVWFNPDLERRLALRERWRAYGVEPKPVHPVRPYAYRLLTAPYWSEAWKFYDAGNTGLQLEIRHPLFDLRVMRFLLSLPSLPWCPDKELFRLAMRGLLPDAIVGRRKTPLQGDPLRALLARPESRWVDDFEPHPSLAAFVDRRRVPPATASNPPQPEWLSLRPLSLNYWLSSPGAPSPI